MKLSGKEFVVEHESLYLSEVRRGARDALFATDSLKSVRAPLSTLRVLVHTVRSLGDLCAVSVHVNITGWACDVNVAPL